jgi:alkylated DNA repair protein alkB family protein 6
MTFDLEAARITSLPQDAFYIADFITEAEEELLLQKVPYPIPWDCLLRSIDPSINLPVYLLLTPQILSAPLPRWTQLSHRRLQTWPSALTKSNTLLAAPLPPWLVDPIIAPRFESLGIFAEAPHGAPNHVLVNEYRPGQGIMPHEDGAAYYPLVATVSMGAPIVLDLYEKRGGEGSAGEGVDGDEGRTPQFRILQERRSLLIMRRKIYTDFLHGIAETREDTGLGRESVCNWDLLREKSRFEDGVCQRETRISLTYRDVLKVSRLGNTMKFLGAR